jgi:hypothetical protein
MQRRGECHLVGPVYAAGSTFVPYLENETETILQKQGCTFVKGEKKWNTTVIAITYPKGSTRQEVYSRITGCRDLIILPNGFELLEFQDAYGRCRGLW